LEKYEQSKDKIDYIKKIESIRDKLKNGNSNEDDDNYDNNDA
jgi:hypothetical protein